MRWPEALGEFLYPLGPIAAGCDVGAREREEERDALATTGRKGGKEDVADAPTPREAGGAAAVSHPSSTH